jgi:hypothetical protein
LGSWILVPFLKLGLSGIIVEKWLNCLYGAISVALYFFLIKKLRISIRFAVAIMCIGTLLIFHFAIARLFADMLMVMLLLLYLNICCSKDFGGNYKGIILASIVAGICFYAKAYTFYFVLLHLPITLLLLARKDNQKYFTFQSLKKILLAISLLTFIASFWFIALHYKYGHFVLGQKNITGTLTEIYSPPNKLIYPPPKSDYAIFDDITYFNYTDITPFKNLKLLVIQLKIIAFNFFNLIDSFNEFSFAFIMVLLIGYLFAFNNKTFFSKEINNIKLLTFLTLWPSGFLLFSIQSRFLWITDLLILALTGVLLTELMKASILKKKFLQLFCYSILISFCFYPILQLKMEYGSGKNLFKMAETLRTAKINGRILTNIHSSSDYSKSIILNYLLGSKFYGPYKYNYTSEQILEAIKQYHINYYLVYYNSPEQKKELVTNILALNAKRIYEDLYPGIVVLCFY